MNLIFVYYELHTLNVLVHTALYCQAISLFRSVLYTRIGRWQQLSPRSQDKVFLSTFSQRVFDPDVLAWNFCMPIPCSATELQTKVTPVGLSLYKHYFHSDSPEISFHWLYTLVNINEECIESVESSQPASQSTWLTHNLLIENNGLLTILLYR